MQFYYQSELNNLSNETIKEIEGYMEDNFKEKFFYPVGLEYNDLRNDAERVCYLDQLADDLNLKKFNLTDYQAIIVAYMYMNDRFNRAYVYDVMKMLEDTL